MPRILIVEDNPVEACEIGFFLRNAGFDCEICEEAESGLARLVADRFDLLLADLHLPGQNGFAFCRTVKADQRLKGLPVVLLTRFADPLNVLRGLEAGADGFISKGQQPEEIVARLQRVLGRQTISNAAPGEAADRVVFLQTEFRVDASRDQLLEVLLSGFEDAVCLHDKYEREVVSNAKAQKSILDLTTLYQSLVETLPLAILRKDIDGVYTFVNAEYCKLLGRSAEEILGKKDADLFPRSVAERFERDDCIVLGAHRVLDQIEDRCDSSGSRTYEHLRRVALRNSEGEPIGIQGIAWDVTDLKRAEHELQTLNRSLEERVAQRTEELAKRNAELIQRNTDLDQYAYVASHDLQEPLRKLISFSQLLEIDASGELSDAAKQDLFYIQEAARRMQRLVQDLLAFSRIGRAAMSYETVDLNECVDRALEALAMRVEETGATIVRQWLPGLPGDKTLLTQLYQNLIGNALKFVGSQRPEVQLTAEAHDDHWVLGVLDNGIGIAPEYRQQIFAPFQRLHSRQEYDGTGVGLAICQAAVERHDGRIWVESEPGHGSHFKFTLPRVAVDSGKAYACLLAAEA